MLSHRIDADADLVLLQPYLADELFAVVERNRARLRRWLPWVDATHRADDTRTFLSIALEQLAAGTGLHLGIRLHERLVGTIGLNDIDATEKHAHIGYWIAESCEGRGLVTRSAAALMQHGFLAYALERIEIRCAKENVKSRRIPERLGFVEEGTLRRAHRVGDRFDDLVVYAKLRDA